MRAAMLPCGPCPSRRCPSPRPVPKSVPSHQPLRMPLRHRPPNRKVMSYSVVPVNHCLQVCVTMLVSVVQVVFSHGVHPSHDRDHDGECHTCTNFVKYRKRWCALAGNLKSGRMDDGPRLSAYGDLLPSRVLEETRRIVSSFDGLLPADSRDFTKVNGVIARCQCDYEVSVCTSSTMPSSCRCVCSMG